MSIEHRSIPENQLHSSIRWRPVDFVALLALTPATEDIGKFAQVGDGATAKVYLWTAAGAWAPVNPTVTGVEEALIDGVTRGRLNGAWTPLIPSGKPLAGANKVAHVNAGYSAQQAFDELDAFDYAGEFTGQIIIDGAHVFTSADQLSLFGRMDCTWLRIISAQFPTAHTVSGTFVNNVLENSICALFGFVNSAVALFTVSVDMSASATATVAGLCIQGGSVFAVGDVFSSAPCEMTRAASGFAAQIQDSSIFLMRIRGDAVYVSGCSGTVLSNTAKGTSMLVSKNVYQNATVTVESAGRLVCYENLGRVTVAVTGGSPQMTLAGDILVSAAPAATPLVNSRPFAISDDLKMQFDQTNVVTWQPQSAGDGLLSMTAGADERTNKDVQVDISALVVDTSVSAAYNTVIAFSGSFASSEFRFFGVGTWGGNAKGYVANVRDALNTIIYDSDEQAGYLRVDTNTQGLTPTQQFNAQQNIMGTYTWAAKPAANSVSTRTKIIITDVGVTDVMFYSNGTRWLAVNGQFVGRLTNIDVPSSGSAETIADVYTAAADLLGPNGGIDVDVIASCTGSVNAKIVNVYIGTTGSGITGTKMALISTGTGATTISITLGRAIFNRNNLASQISEAQTSTAYGGSATAVTTATINTANSTDFTVSIQATNAADVVTSRSVRWIITTAP